MGTLRRFKLDKAALTNVTGNLIERAAAIIALADQISRTEATDEDIADVLKRLRAEVTPANIAAVRVVLAKGKSNG